MPERESDDAYQFVLLSGLVANPAIDEQSPGQGTSPPGQEGIDTEHPLDVTDLLRSRQGHLKTDL